MELFYNLCNFLLDFRKGWNVSMIRNGFVEMTPYAQAMRMVKILVSEVIRRQEL